MLTDNISNKSYYLAVCSYFPGGTFCFEVANKPTCNDAVKIPAEKKKYAK